MATGIRIYYLHKKNMNHIFNKEALVKKLISTYFLSITNVICIHMARLRPVKMVVCNILSQPSI